MLPNLGPGGAGRARSVSAGRGGGGARQGRGATGGGGKSYFVKHQEGSTGAEAGPGATKRKIEDVTVGGVRSARGGHGARGWPGARVEEPGVHVTGRVRLSCGIWCMFDECRARNGACSMNKH